MDVQNSIKLLFNYPRSCFQFSLECSNVLCVQQAEQWFGLDEYPMGTICFTLTSGGGVDEGSLPLGAMGGESSQCVPVRSTGSFIWMGHQNNLLNIVKTQLKNSPSLLHMNLPFKFFVSTWELTKFTIYGYNIIQFGSHLSQKDFDLKNLSLFHKIMQQQHFSLEYD